MHLHDKVWLDSNVNAYISLKNIFSFKKKTSRKTKEIYIIFTFHLCILT